VTVEQPVGRHACPSFLLPPLVFPRKICSHFTLWLQIENLLLLEIENSLKSKTQVYVVSKHNFFGTSLREEKNQEEFQSAVFFPFVEVFWCGIDREFACFCSLSLSLSLSLSFWEDFFETGYL
jgi:hypothetical protein